MAPSSSQKGTGKKGGASAIRQQQQQQQQRSRNTTPGPAPPSASLPPFETVETETIELRFDIFRNLTFEDMVDTPSLNSLIPDSKSLDGIITRLQRLGDAIEKRGTHCDRGMRLLAQTRRQRMDELAMERGREAERRQREADDGERKSNKKKRKGADTLAPHDRNTGRFFLPSHLSFHELSYVPLSVMIVFCFVFFLPDCASDTQQCAFLYPFPKTRSKFCGYGTKSATQPQPLTTFPFRTRFPPSRFHWEG